MTNIPPTKDLKSTVPAICPKCGKRFFKKLQYPWTGTLPAKFYCTNCSRENLNLHITEEYTCGASHWISK